MHPFLTYWTKWKERRSPSKKTKKKSKRREKVGSRQMSEVSGWQDWAREEFISSLPPYLIRSYIASCHDKINHGENEQDLSICAALSHTFDGAVRSLPDTLPHQPPPPNNSSFALLYILSLPHIGLLTLFTFCLLYAK